MMIFQFSNVRGFDFLIFKFSRSDGSRNKVSGENQVKINLSKVFQQKYDLSIL